MIGALIACILVLGFNYWVSSSRNLELQTKLYELEGQVRRGAAENGAAQLRETEFQEVIHRQMEQISLYKTQLEGAHTTCSQEKGSLQHNVSSSSKTIQELKGQLNQLNFDLGKLQKELKSCQGNIKTLNNKLTYDMTHCNSQVLSQKEICDERVAAAKLEVQKKMEKLILPLAATSQQANTENGAVKEDGPDKTVDDAVKTATVVSHIPSFSQPKEKETSELLMNEIIVAKDPEAPGEMVLAKDLSEVESQAVPSSTAVKEEVLLPPGGAVTTDEGEAETSKLLRNNLTEDKEMELLDTHEDGTQIDDPGMEGTLTGQVKADKTPAGQKTEEPEEYDEQVEDGINLEKQQQSKRPESMDLEQELADYNGDDENEGEFEADKQAELARV